MENTTWLEHLVPKKELWYCDGQDTFPPLFYQLYSRLQQFASQKDLYGFFLQLRDIFEFLIRWYDLTGFALAAYIQDMDTVSALCDPEHAYSFGDWVQIPPSKLKCSPSIGSTSLGKLLEVLNRHYNKAKIVSWRNESIGHGAIQPDTSQDFLGTLEGKLSDLTQCLSAVVPMAKNIIYYDTPGTAYSCSIDNGPPFPLEPFIYRVKDDHQLFDSLHRGNNSGKVLSYQTGKRTSIDMSFLHELSSRYYGMVPITVEGSFNDAVFSGKLDAVLQHFHASNRYWKQTHYFAWLFDCLSKYSHGVFLLRSESGTGKSVFTDQLDGSGKQALFKQGFICRTYHFSRMSVRPSSEFPFALGDLFRRFSECEDELHGQLPALTYQLPPEQRGSAMTAFLQAFQALYKRTYGHSKMLLILDGIDHLAPEDTHLLNFIPNSNSLTEGLYILVTCSSTPQQGTFQQDFLDSFSFTETITFQKDGENTDLLKKAISESITLSGQVLTPKQVERIAQIADHHFPALPVIRALLEHTDHFEDIQNITSLLEAYLDLLERLYGIHHFSQLLSVLLTFALAVEPLSIRLTSQLAFGQSPTAELLAVMRDLSPLLVSINRKSQTLYVLGHSDFGEYLRKKYARECQELVLNWRLEISGGLYLQTLEYDSSAYIASGMVFWSKNILGEDIADISLLENLDKIAEFFSQSRNTAPHIARTSRILASAQDALINRWRATKDIRAVTEAIHNLAVSIPKLLLMDDTPGCEYADERSELLIGELPQNVAECPALVRALFFNYENRSALMSKLGNYEKRITYEGKAQDLIERYPQHIPNFQQISFYYNRAIDLLHTDPQSAIKICDTIFSFPESDPFQKSRSLLTKSDALKKINKQKQADVCIRQAVQLIENVPPRTRVDAETYPSALRHLGSHLCHIEEDFETAISIFEKILFIFTQQDKANELPSRFSAANILSELGNAYYGLDTKNSGIEHKQDALWHIQQSIEVFRTVQKEGIKFQPASAEAPYVNAAYALDYYGLKTEAVALIRELMKMQQDDICGHEVINRCKKILEEL